MSIRLTQDMRNILAREVSQHAHATELADALAQVDNAAMLRYRKHISEDLEKTLRSLPEQHVRWTSGLTVTMDYYGEYKSYYHSYKKGILPGGGDVQAYVRGRDSNNTSEDSLLLDAVTRVHDIHRITEDTRVSTMQLLKQFTSIEKLHESWPEMCYFIDKYLPDAATKPKLPVVVDFTEINKKLKLPVKKTAAKKAAKKATKADKK